MNNPPKWAKDSNRHLVEEKSQGANKSKKTDNQPQQ